MKTNRKPVITPRFTHEGARAANIGAESELKRSVFSCLLWEDTFYESGEDIARRIMSLVPRCRPEFVAACAAHARGNLHLRHVPLLLVREMARHASHKHLVGKLLADVIMRPDEIAEFVSIYWKDGRSPLSAQVKKGLAAAFQKFTAFQLAKYDNQRNAVKLRDVAFLCHVKPWDAEGRATKVDRTYKDGTKVELKRHKKSTLAGLIEGTLPIPDTWETMLSAGADKKQTFETLMMEKKLGGLAFLRNLRNMTQAGVDKSLISEYAKVANFDRVLPFRFIAAARIVPHLEDIIEAAMLRSLESAPKLPGRTVIVVDNSGSMHGPKVSAKSDIDRADAAAALAVLLREISDDVVVIGYGSTAEVIAPRRGFALVDAIKKGPGGGTDTRRAVALANAQRPDRIIVITDEQSSTVPMDPACDKAYFINVATYQNGIGYGKWTHIDGWSESVVTFIRETELQ